MTTSTGMTAKTGYTGMEVTVFLSRSLTTTTKTTQREIRRAEQRRKSGKRGGQQLLAYTEKWITLPALRYMYFYRQHHDDITAR